MPDPATSPLKQAIADLLARDAHVLPDPLLLVSTEELLTARSTNGSANRTRPGT